MEEIRQYCANRGLQFDELAYNFQPPKLQSLKSKRENIKKLQITQEETPPKMPLGRRGRSSSVKIPRTIEHVKTLTKFLQDTIIHLVINVLLCEIQKLVCINVIFILQIDKMHRGRQRSKSSNS